MLARSSDNHFASALYDLLDGQWNEFYSSGVGIFQLISQTMGLNIILPQSVQGMQVQDMQACHLVEETQLQTQIYMCISMCLSSLFSENNSANILAQTKMPFYRMNTIKSNTNMVSCCHLTSLLGLFESG